MLAVQTVLDVDERPRPRRECRIVAVETEDRVVAFVGRAARGIFYARTRTLALCSRRIREEKPG
jgi:hypothetical protein